MIARESFDSLSSYWKTPDNNLEWNSVFVLPIWLKAWWQCCRTDAELYLTSVRHNADIIGIAPLQVKDKKAMFIGSTDTCDYMDFIIAPGRESEFFNALVDDLKQKGVNHLDLGHLRADSKALVSLVPVARSRGYEVSCYQDTVSLEMDLPPAWEEYLGLLTAKQRHEIRRKLRRLGEMGNFNYRSIEDRDEVHDFMDTFLKLFAESREDKATFLTTQMKSFFRSIADIMADAKLLRLGILELDKIPAAAVICFDYNDTVHLFNSGYAPEYGYLSVGILSKALCIKDSIERGRKKFDFLKGAEIYKYHLGGREIPLYCCQITIK